MRPRRGRTYFVLAIFLMFALFEDASSLFIVRRLTAFGCFASGYEPSPPSATARSYFSYSLFHASLFSENEYLCKIVNQNA